MTLTFCLVLESSLRVTCDVGYLCDNSSLPGLSFLDLVPVNATNVRQVGVRQHHRFMPPPIRGEGMISIYPKQLCQTFP